MKMKSIDFTNKLLQVLDNSPKSILEISKQAETTWEATKNEIAKLLNLDLVIKIEKKDNKKNDFYILNNFPQTKKIYNTYFNLPINLEDKNKIENYYFWIKKFWEEKGKIPKITQIYKTLALLDKNLKLNLPIGWYNFGKIPILIYDETKKYEENKILLENEENEMKKIIDKYFIIDKIYLLNEKHYDDFKKKSYLKKNEIITNFNIKKFNEKNSNEKKKLIDENLIDDLKNLYCLVSQEKINNKFKDYLYLFYLFLLEIKNKEVEVEENYNEIIILFKEIWNFITIDYFKKSFENNYNKTLLEKNFKNKIKNKKQELDEKFSELFFNFEIKGNLRENEKYISRLTWEEVENLDQDEISKEFGF